MLFYSTNGKAKKADFRTALLNGLAPDGGLYMPTEWAKISNFQFSIFNLGKFAAQILSKFIDIPIADLKKITEEAFNFPVPLVKLDKNLYVLELFHGPTLSFKDFGARFMARAMAYYVANDKSQMTNDKKVLNIIVATSGDTGSAVAAGFYGLPNIKVFVLYPSKRISKLQEQQIATWGKNIVALEVKGDFDDCQKLAKQALGDPALRKKINLSSANSINIGRLLPQMYYYFAALEQLRKFSIFNFQFPIIVVPSGNFGNLTAGLFAKRLGLPVNKFIAAVNTNSQIPKYLETGKLKHSKTRLTLSNAMDVGNPSNWDRIRELYDHDDDKIRKNISQDLEAITVSEAETKKTIRDVYNKYNYIADPHTAVGISAAFINESSSPVIVLATAHPAKFPETAPAKIKTPPALSKVMNKKKKSIPIEPNYKALKRLLIQSRL